MAEFQSWRDYWNFADYVMKSARHVFNTKNSEFIRNVVETSEQRRATISIDTPLWRAQLGCESRIECINRVDDEDPDVIEIDCPYHAQRMKPLRDRATEGRVNPKGIPCLYCSTDCETAMTETRPWIGSHVTVAKLELRGPISVVDVTRDLEGVTYPIFGEPKPSKREAHVWNSINRAFARPVTRIDDDNVAEYAPTQVLAEAFREAGFDGIKYASRLGKGKSIAIFDPEAAKVTDCELYSVENVSLEYKLSTNWKDFE